MLFHSRMLSGKIPRPFHEITKYVAIFYWRTPRHIFLELPFLPHLVQILASCKTDQLDFCKISGLCNLIKHGEAWTHLLTKYYSDGRRAQDSTQEVCRSLLPLVTNEYWAWTFFTPFMQTHLYTSICSDCMKISNGPPSPQTHLLLKWQLKYINSWVIMDAKHTTIMGHMHHATGPTPCFWYIITYFGKMACSL